VNQARYVDFVDDARRSAGLGRLLGVSLSYERETLAGDTLAIELGAASPAEGHSVAATRHAFRMVRAGDGALVHRGVFDVAAEPAP
jgi:hypothetical protein